MNERQKILLRTYASGDYAWLIDDHDDPEQYLIDDGGDTLVLFLYRELADDADTDMAEHVRRLYRAQGDIQEIIDALDGSKGLWQAR